MTGSLNNQAEVPDQTASGDLLQDAGLPQDAAALARVGEYLTRTKRARRLGLVVGLAGCFVMGSRGGRSLALELSIVLVGYLLGVLLGELTAPTRSRGNVRSASMQPREMTSLLPSWALWAPWVTLLPAAGAPLLLIGSHPQGVTAYQTPSSSCWALAQWPSAQVLWAVACAALVALSVSQLTVRRLIQLPRPAEDEPMARVDLVLRGVSARAVVGGATSLGLLLFSGTVYLLVPGLESRVCVQSAPRSGELYPFGHALNAWIQPAGLVVLTVSLLIWAVSRRRVDPRLRRGDSQWL
jgi:hypothetical protein